MWLWGVDRGRLLQNKSVQFPHGKMPCVYEDGAVSYQIRKAA